ncbi:MAG: DUF5309 family protein [Lentisphaeria bacterium]
MSDPVKVYSLTNKTRDLSSVLNTVVQKYGGFLGLFTTAPKATNTKHEWLQDSIAGRGFTVTAYASGAATLSAADYAKVRVGTQFKVKGYAVIFKVSELAANNKIKATVFAANGNSTKTAMAANDVCQIISTPIAAGSKLGEGDNTHRSVGTEYNYTMIIRKDTGITRSDLDTSTYDKVENSIARQTEFALDQTRRDLSRCAIWGVRTERDAAGENGEAGGLYSFCTKSIVASGARISSKLVNDASQKITEAGGTPTAVVCSPAQARVLSNELKDKVQIQRDDPTRGVYVATIINESGGGGMTIIGDVDFDDCDAFVVDKAAFGISYLHPTSDEDSTTKGTDGISRMVITEFTFEFHNAAERICKISGLQDPATAIAAISAAENTVNVTASAMTVTPTTMTVEADAVTVNEAAAG